MITLNQLEKKYKKRISKKFKIAIEKYINDDYVQSVLKKAMRYELEDKDRDFLYEVGHHNSKQFPYLYYLAAIYITPYSTIIF
ncbi:unnamed protein product [marine sediment metagenome]|uniref:Uncharacterized protein n=1 Tax=marine sediment metagenome TaxID=412755 RepID=X1HGJ0_9ZZZZ